MSFIIYILILIFSVVIHEVSHGYVAYSLGDSTAKMSGRLTLNPMKHLDWYGSLLVPVVIYVLSSGFATFGWAKPVPYNPYNLRGGKWGPAMVAAAGPLSNLVIAFAFGFFVRFSGIEFSATFIQLASVVVLVNVMLAIFNLLPVPPLDGSKILGAILPYQWRSVEAFFRRYWLFLLLAILLADWRLIIEFPIAFTTELILGEDLLRQFLPV